MENNQERVLAYNLAKELNPNDLGEVSGGGNGMRWTQAYCAVQTGSVEKSDAIMDFSPDC